MLLSAAPGENGISVAPDGTQLKWEKGRHDFFIMHKTLLYQSPENLTNSDANNPQADTCIDQTVGSTYTLTSEHIPPDASIDRAFLVWLAPQDPDNLAVNTDNSVTLTFTNAADPSITLTQEVKASIQGNLATTTIGMFEYEAINMPADSNSGATGVYTYRVEVSDFMKKIIAMGKEKGLESGEALYGDYNVKGMECSNHQNYLSTSGLVGGWFMPFVYTSSLIRAKKIYFYNGLASYKNTTTTVNISGFELPDEAIIKLGFVVFEGDPGMANSNYLNNPEGLQISGQADPTNFAPIYNSCNPPKTTGTLNYTEMYNSISSIFGWDDDVETCIGNPNYPLDTSNPLEYAIDADILMVDTSPSGPFSGRFHQGDTSFNLKIGANQDQIYTNMLIVSVDTASADDDTVDTDDQSDTSDSTDSSDSDKTDTGDSDPADSGSHSGNNGGSDTDNSDSSSNTESENWGELGGECYPNGTCNKGLACDKKKNICVEPLQIKSSGGCMLLTIG